MIQRSIPLFALFSLFCLALSAKPKPQRVRLETTAGTIRIELSDETPIHRDNFLKLCRSGYYDGTIFHRVIKDFMIQGGDGDTLDYTLPAEFNLPWLYHVRGAVAAAREGDDVNPEMRSSASQFYIVYGRSWGENSLGKQRGALAEKGIEMNYEMWNDYLQHGGSPHLDGTYTVFGHVIEGMKVVKTIQATETDKDDRPLKDVVIRKAIVE